MSIVRRMIELDASTDGRLSEIAARRGQDVAGVIAEAIELLDSAPVVKGPDLVEDRRRLEEFRRARVAVPLGDVKAWTESWDAEVESPRPSPRKLG
jgi:predicted transcriptional regulator